MKIQIYFTLKGNQKVFNRGYKRGKDRYSLGKSVSGMTYSSKEYHKKLSSLDEKSFSMGNLKDVPISKNVISQCHYEYRKSNQPAVSVVESLKLLKKQYENELGSKSVPGFIQFISVCPLTIALWSEKDIELFHEMSKHHSLVVDATGTIASKLNFAFISFDRSLKTEPVPHIEILTDRASTKTLEFVLTTFLEDEMKRFGYTTHSVPILYTTDCSWPIIKCLVSAFNKETLEEYILRSHSIATGKAPMNDLPEENKKTFIHISLCHVMKSLCFKVDKCFKKDKQFIKFCMSLLANAGNLNDIIDICKCLFEVLLSKSNSRCKGSKIKLDEQIADIESFREEALNVSSVSCENTTETKEGKNIEDNDLPIKEETYLQQSKRSIYYKKCKVILQKLNNKLDKVEQQTLFINSNNSVVHGETGDKTNYVDDENVFYSPIFAEYLLNNWCGLLPLWTSLHLGDQGRHGASDIYKGWSNKFKHFDCVKDPPKTQGIIEFHHKSVKHITMNSKRERVDNVISNLYIAKKSKLRQLEISKSRKGSISLRKEEKIKDTMPKTIVTEKWNKRKRKQAKGPGFFQKNKIIKKISKSQEEWEKLPVIPWGGNYVLPTGETIQLYHTCTIDNFLEIIFLFYSINLHQMRKLFDSDDSLVRKICEGVQLLLTYDFEASKFNWVTTICAQNKCIRFCLMLGSRVHVGVNEFKRINWLPTRERFEQCVCVSIFNFFAKTTPFIFQRCIALLNRVGIHKTLSNN